MNQLLGTGIALVTPFHTDGTIDFESLEKLIDLAVAKGVNYLVVLGTTAETATLSKEEKHEIVEAVKKYNNKRLPLVIGIGGNNTKTVIEEIQQTDLSDFVAILSVSPAYNKPIQEGIYQHFKTIAEATKHPIILYNVPGRTGSNIEAKTTLKLAHEFSHIVAIKEASPNILQAMDIIKDKSKDFMVISGDDEFALPIVLAGGSGVISVIAQGIPELFTASIKFGLERKVDEAYNLHFQYTDLIRMIFEEGNPAGIKTVLNARGIGEKTVRLPLTEASEDLIERIENKLKTLSII